MYEGTTTLQVNNLTNLIKQLKNKIQTNIRTALARAHISENDEATPTRVAILDRERWCGRHAEIVSAYDTNTVLKLYVTALAHTAFRSYSVMLTRHVVAI